MESLVTVIGNYDGFEIRHENKKDTKGYVSQFFVTTKEKVQEYLTSKSWNLEILPAKVKLQKCSDGEKVYWIDFISECDGVLMTKDNSVNPNDNEFMEIKQSDVAEMEGNETNAEFLRTIGK